MRHKLETAIPLLALITAMIFPAAVANAQNAAPVSLQEQLSAQYKLVKVGNATGEVTIVEPGTMLSIQKGGIVGVIPKSVAICPSKFEGGNLKGPSGFCLGMVGKQNTRYLTVGEKVYPLKIDVNPGK